MKSYMLPLLAGTVSGSVVAVMMRLNATLGAHIGVLESAFVVHLAGTLLALVVLVHRFNREFFGKIRKTPRHLFSGGLLGIGIVLIGNITVPVLGMVVTMSLFITADLLFCTTADHFGFFGLPPRCITRRRSLGLLLTLTGLILVFWR